MDHDPALANMPNKLESVAVQGTSGASKTTTPTPTPTATTETKKISNAELKKQQKAEKAAKRAAKKVDTGQTQAQAQVPTSAVSNSSQKKGQPQQSAKGGPPKSGSNASQTQTSNKEQMALPHRARRSSTILPVSKVPAVKVPATKQVSLFGHLYGQARRYGIEGANKEVYPAVVALGLQMSSYEVCGSTARCIAMLLAFKSVVQSYNTPQGHALARHFIPHHLSPQIDYLRSCRPISVSMGNAIRILKDVIANVDPSTSDLVAKRDICSFIDGFIHEKFTAADELISQTACSKILPNDVVLVYAKSSLVLKTLLHAKSKGTPFRVIVLDSKPLFEGKQMALDLVAAGIAVQYSLIPAAAHAVAESTKVLLGAHAMMANGRLYSRVGTAIVAMLAQEQKIPVIVCCESVKFTERVALDSIVGNEVAPVEELLSGNDGAAGLVKRWQETPNLQMLNLLYDVTPAEMVKMVVTEFGSLPPSSVPAVLRILEETSGRP